MYLKQEKRLGEKVGYGVRSKLMYGEHSTAHQPQIETWLLCGKGVATSQLYVHGFLTSASIITGVGRGAQDKLG